MGKSADLSRERIVTEAIALLDDEGIAGLSMRRLAHRLGVKAASLYHHIRGQDDLIDAMHDEINAMIDLDLLRGTTSGHLAAFARSYRLAYLRHPDAVALVSRRPLTARSALDVYGAIATHLIARGLPMREVMPVMAALDFVVLGSAGDTLAADFHRKPTEYAREHPTLSAALLAADGRSVDEEAFELGLEFFLEAVARRLALVSP